MKIKNDWTFFLKVSSPAKAEKLVPRLIEVVGLPLSVTGIERYWKDKSLFKVSAHVELRAVSPPDAFYTVMQAASRLAGSWTIAGPHGDDDFWEFGGTASQGTLRLPGVDSVVFNASFAPTPAEDYSHIAETEDTGHLISS
jgi:hypothetical protein